MKPLYWFAAGALAATLVLRIAYGYPPVSLNLIGLKFHGLENSPEIMKAIVAFAYAANAIGIALVIAIVCLFVGRKT